MSTTTDRIAPNEVLPINHKNHNFRGKRNNQVMQKKPRKFALSADKGGVNILKKLPFLPVYRRQNTKASARTRARNYTTLNVIG